MANLNKVMLLGNITRDPELRTLPGGTSVADFGMAINRKWQGSDGQKKEEVTFVDCSVFGKLADVICQYKKKGDPLFVEGRLKLEQWEAQDGIKRSKIKVIVEGFQFLNRSEGNGQGGEPQQRGRANREQQAAPVDDGGVIDEADVPF